MNEQTNKFPLWLEAHKRMRDEGMTFGSQWEAGWFESVLKCKRDSNDFVFSMLNIKQAIEEEDGYYLEQLESGNIWRIPEAALHEDVCKGFERRMRNYASRAITLRNRVLTNDNAKLTNEQRAIMDKSAEIAAVRRILLRRESSVISCVREHKPKLLTTSVEE